ncbi:hypothetical protein [Paraburkholderia sp. BL6665CI2N2]|uniref:hypothetical protein n=1 Tax=Paraburkholderia sp. BL6665CI2N2 TaxID=1938806 RepID=UPI001AB02758|nr:hypothetical protein [Paraburkholderia sp. BL6665CI2N2]
MRKTAAQLAGTERFLKMQNDAVRLQASGEADALRAQNSQLRERIDHLLLEVDQYRRTLSSRPPGGAERAVRRDGSPPIGLNVGSCRQPAVRAIAGSR